jgi:hypothetical protein
VSIFGHRQIFGDTTVLVGRFGSLDRRKEPELAAKLASLQILWGVAGAREKFEDMVCQLIHVERPDSQRIRIVKGDGGLDSFVGELRKPVGIDVFQVKYFPGKIDDAQKGQIRDSFATVRDSNKFKVKSWTLCLPVDMSLEETEWFEGWKAKQAGSGIEIRQPWGALHIENLLLQEKNQTIREAFFREESTVLLREQVGVLNELKQQGSRSLKVRVSPVWDRRKLQAQMQLFNNGTGAISVTNWWIQWGQEGTKWARGAAHTIRGTLPIRLEEHEGADLMIPVDRDVEDLSGIGVVDGDGHLWLATDENMVIFRHEAIAHRLPGTEEPTEKPSAEGLKMDVTARATRPAGLDHDLLEVVIKNECARPVLVHNVRLGWTYSPPRQKPKFPGKPSVAEAGGGVGLSRKSATNQVAPGEQVVFVLQKEMSLFLVEVARGDVLDEDIVLEFVTDEKWSWKATTAEISSVVRAVANSVVESMRR